MSITITSAQKIRVLNTGSDDESFVPYKENFTCTLAAGKAVEFATSCTNEALYYLEQSKGALVVRQIGSFDDGSDDILVITSSTTITLTNGTDAVVGFVPYKENFTCKIPTSASVTLPAKSVNQFLYYLKQSANTDITVTYA